MGKTLLTLLLSVGLFAGNVNADKVDLEFGHDKNGKIRTGPGDIYAPEGEEEVDDLLGEEMVRVNEGIYDFQEELKRHKLKLPIEVKDIRFDGKRLEGYTFNQEIINEDLQALYSTVGTGIDALQFRLSQFYIASSDEEPIKRTSINIEARFYDRANISFGIEKLEKDDTSSENQID